MSPAPARVPPRARATTTPPSPTAPPPAPCCGPSATTAPATSTTWPTRWRSARPQGRCSLPGSVAVPAAQRTTPRSPTTAEPGRSRRQPSRPGTLDRNDPCRAGAGGLPGVPVLAVNRRLLAGGHDGTLRLRWHVLVDTSFLPVPDGCERGLFIQYPHDRPQLGLI